MHSKFQFWFPTTYVIYSLDKHLLSNFYVLSIILGAKDNKSSKVVSPVMKHVLWKRKIMRRK